MGNLVIFNIDKKCPSPDREEERGGERILFINKRLVSPVLLCKDWHLQKPSEIKGHS